MGRPAVSSNVSGGAERLRPGVSGRSEAADPGASARRPEGPRKLIPWSDIERRLAQRLADPRRLEDLREDAPPGAPPSRLDDVQPEAPRAAPASGANEAPPWSEPPGASGELTYSVYTVADLEARAKARARATAPLIAASPQPTRWHDVGRSAAGVLRAGDVWLRSSPRPPLLDVVRLPLQILVTDLRAVLRGLPWRRFAIISGAALAAAFALLCAVLVAADLTDDLKPGRSIAASAAEPPAREDAPPPAAAAAAEPETPVIEIDDVAAPAAASEAPRPQLGKRRATAPGPNASRKKVAPFRR